MKKSILILAITIVACKKQPAILPGGGQTTPYNPKFSYVVSVNNNKDTSVGNAGDTLLITLNGVVKVNQIGAAVGAQAVFNCVTGDQISIYYNPGTELYGQKVIIRENSLVLDFNSVKGSAYEINFGGCRCIGNTKQTIK